MKTVNLFCLLFVFSATSVWGQNDYIVKTSPQRSTAATEEERFVENNFPYYSLCEWQPGMKFMYLLEDKYSFIPTFSSYETREVANNNDFHQKILFFQGIEVQEPTTQRSNPNTWFIFQTDDGKKYYHEFKNQRPGEICLNTPRAHIKGLIYLGDVDKARELLMNRVLFTKTNMLRVDDPNSGNGYREVETPLNLRLTVRAIGVGSREYPVKIVFDDSQGRSYFVEMAFSTTNSGLVKADFQGDKRMKFFPNIFNFHDPHEQTINEIKARYAGNYIYPKRNMDARMNGSSAVLFRYTPLRITDMDIDADKISATLKLQDNKGNVYTVPVKLKYDTVIKNEDYINDVFAEGNIHAEYPYITEENWALIVNGNIKIGMTKDECRLSLGSPIQIVANLNSVYETWFYNGKVLDFDNGVLARIK